MELSIPSSIVSKVDIARILRELNALNDFFISAKNRPSGTPVQPPKLSRQLDMVAKDNKFNLLNLADRQNLAAQLDNVIGKAPLLHISFASEPSPKALERILLWFRQNVHHQALLQVGLQPTIAAGCVVRTSNKVFDLSMREFLKNQEPYLVQLINSAGRN
jgi:F0F1-type ATP synthase delta subunit